MREGNVLNTFCFSFVPVDFSLHGSLSLCTHFIDLLHRNTMESKLSTSSRVEIRLKEHSVVFLFRILVDPLCSCTDQKENQFYVKGYPSCLQSEVHMGSMESLKIPGLSYVPLEDIRILHNYQEASHIIIDEKYSSYDIGIIRSFIQNEIVYRKSFLLDRTGFFSAFQATIMQDNQKDIFKITKKTSIGFAKQQTASIKQPKNQELELASLLELEDVKRLKDLLSITALWPITFPESLFAPPCGILLKSENSEDAQQILKVLLRPYKSHMVSFGRGEATGMYVGDAEENLRTLFDDAKVPTNEYDLSIIYIDNIDAFCGKRDERRNAQENRLVGQLLTLMDGIQGQQSDLEALQCAPRLIVASTQNPKEIDEALRRSGRFDYELWLGKELSGVQAIGKRREILSSLFGPLPLHPSFLTSQEYHIHKLAESTNSFSFEELRCLVKEAFTISMIRSKKEQKSFEGPGITWKDCFDALHIIRPSNIESQSPARPICWEDIGGLEKTKLLLQKAIEWPLRFAKQFERMNLKVPNGILLYGPPGCCKTTLVKAAAHSSNASFLSLNGADIYSPYFGDSEHIIRDTFKHARSIQPCLLFIDEIEAVVGKRIQDADSNGVQERILSTLLNELDGVGISDGQSIESHVILIAATNRPDMIDSALLRPGRFDEVIYVPRPSEIERLAILKVKSKRLPLHEGVNLSHISGLCDGFTGADIENLCREAALCALQGNIFEEKVVCILFQLSDILEVLILPAKHSAHFDIAFQRVKNSVVFSGYNDDIYTSFIGSQ